jgi:hypothetical protein
MDQYDKALQQFTKLQTMIPHHPEVEFQIATLYPNQKRKPAKMQKKKEVEGNMPASLCLTFLWISIPVICSAALPRQHCASRFINAHDFPASTFYVAQQPRNCAKIRFFHL